jgi:hypothetical protein
MVSGVTTSPFRLVLRTPLVGECRFLFPEMPMFTYRTKTIWWKEKEHRYKINVYASVNNVVGVICDLSAANNHRTFITDNR